MSYTTFKAEILAGLKEPHDSKTRAAQVIAQAYTNLILRHFEILTGAGQFIAVSGQTPSLQAGIQSTFLTNIADTSGNRIAVYNQWAPYIYSYWAGQTCVGPTGIVVVTSTGTWQGPIIPETNNPMVWLDVLIGVASSHILSLVGTYTNFYTGITTPWSGALLLTYP